MKLARGNDGKRVDSTQYKILIRIQRYLVTARANIVYEVELHGYHGRITHNLFERGKEDSSLFEKYSDRRYFYVNNKQVKFVRYTNSDWGSDIATRKSTSWCAFHLGIGAILWSSNKQCIDALSIIEA